MEAVTTKRRKSRKKTSVADKVFVTLNTLFMIMFVIVISGVKYAGNLTE